MYLYQNKIFIPIIFFCLALSFVACKSKKTETTSASARGGRPNNLKAEGFIAKAEVFQNDYKSSGTL
jgi:hypothetical protein